jgi:hypothetical protein
LLADGFALVTSAAELLLPLACGWRVRQAHTGTGDTGTGDASGVHVTIHSPGDELGRPFCLPVAGERSCM